MEMLTPARYKTAKIGTIEHNPGLSLEITIHLLFIIIQVNTGHFRFHCHFCRKCFNETTNFSIHMRGHEGKKYKCEYCDKSYTSEINLKYHLSVHTGQYRLKCTLCGKGFNEGKFYQAHLKSHT